jgi:hypothetical protein
VPNANDKTNCSSPVRLSWASHHPMTLNLKNSRVR